MKHRGFIQKMMATFSRFLKKLCCNLKINPLVGIFSLWVHFLTVWKCQKKISAIISFFFDILIFLRRRASIFRKKFKQNFLTWEDRFILEWCIFIFAFESWFSKNAKKDDNFDIFLFSNSHFWLNFGLIFFIKVLIDSFFMQKCLQIESLPVLHNH